MAKRFGQCWLYPLGLVVLGFFLTQGIQAQETALDRYVARPDPNYTYTLYDTQRRRGLYTAYFLRMTSQQWRSASEVDRPIWEHEVIILIPEVALDSTKTAVLLIDGGSNTGTPTTSVPELLGAASIATGAVIAAVRQVPNQPLFFTDDPDRDRKEDEILAYSLDKALDTGDLEWPVHLAMTKAAVRAMDTVQEFAASRGQDVRNFLVLGGSKRGWTTWLTAAVDPRVKAILPASIDMLNLGRQFVHHWEAYGFYAPALNDYVEFDLPCRMQTPQGRAVLQVVDPFAYRDRYAGLPKLVLNASGDQFFVTDSSRFYFAGLPGPKWLLYTPNTDHGQNQDAIERALSWVDDILNNKASATIDWTVRGDGALRVTASSRPKRVRLWQATNPEARDFRLESLGAAWTSRVLEPEPDGAYVGFAPPPAVGWTAFFVEVTFDTAGVFKPDQAYTTDVLITPDVLPFVGTACDGQLEPPAARLESPEQGSFESGIGLIRGWVCDAGSVEIQINDGARRRVAYGSRRADTIEVCGHANTGFGYTVNWNNIGDGAHTLRAFADGREFAQTQFTVTTLGTDFLRGVNGEYPLTNFPQAGRNLALRWSEPHQNFVIAGASRTPASVAFAGAIPLATETLAHLESPYPGSFESGIGLIRGWACDAGSVEIQINDGERRRVAYGSRRADTIEVCGHANTGFGYTVNWNNIGDGAHTLRAFADGREFAQTQFTVTTLGTDFLRGVNGEYPLTNFPQAGRSVTVRWSEPHQNFVIVGYQ